MAPKNYRQLFFIFMVLFFINSFFLYNTIKENENYLKEYNEYKQKHIEELKDNNTEIVYSKECGFQIIDKRILIICDKIIIQQPTQKWQVTISLNQSIKNSTN
jgi:hypothetical protein